MSLDLIFTFARRQFHYADFDILAKHHGVQMLCFLAVPEVEAWLKDKPHVTNILLVGAEVSPLGFAYHNLFDMVIGLAFLITCYVIVLIALMEFCSH